MTFFLIASFVLGLLLGFVGLWIMRMSDAGHTTNTPNNHFRHHS